MKKSLKIKNYLIILMLLLLAGPSSSVAVDVAIISIDELKAQLDSADVTILDVRTGKDWKSSEFKVKGAVRASPNEFDKWSETYPKDKKFVLYCA